MKKGVLIIGSLVLVVSAVAIIYARKNKWSETEIKQNQKAVLINEILSAASGTTIKLDPEKLKKLSETDLESLKYLILKIKNKQQLTTSDKELMTTLIATIKAIK